MYINKYNRNIDRAAALAFIKNNPFATLVTTVNGVPMATHVPILYHINQQGVETLQTHIAKANPQWHKPPLPGAALAIFIGPHHYISSGWYDHTNVPTYNYIAVHVYGTLTILSDKERIKAGLGQMVNHFETDRTNPVSLETMETD